MKIALKNHMTRKLITITTETPVSEARRLMTNFWIRHLPVTNEAGDTVVGMISDRDLIRAQSSEAKAQEIMTAPIKTFPVETPVKTLVNAMIGEKVSAYLITQDQNIIGIVTSEDMLVLLNEMLNEEDSAWSVLQFFATPAFQRTAFSIGQAGI